MVSRLDERICCRQVHPHAASRLEYLEWVRVEGHWQSKLPFDDLVTRFPLNGSPLFSVGY